MTPQQLKQELTPGIPRFGRHKYRAKPVIIDGHRFPSMAEGAHYVRLKELADTGRIFDLELHPRWDLHGPGGQKVGRYTADFRFRDNGLVCVHDVKGTCSRDVRLRLGLLESEYRYKVELIKVKPAEVRNLLGPALVCGRLTCCSCGVKMMPQDLPNLSYCWKCAQKAGVEA